MRDHTQFYFVALAMMVHCVAGLRSDAFQSADASINWRVERQSIEPLLANDLQEIADWCRQNGLQQQADETLGWQLPEDLERKYIFLPTESSRTAPETPLQKQWFDKLTVAIVSHGDRVFEMAKRSAAAGAGATAYQFLHETLHYNPDHEEARRILGFRKTETGWQAAAERIKSSPAKRPHPTMNWQPGTYLIVSTPHFDIASQADEVVTRQLADKLERWHDVWRQVFFEFWSRPTVVDRWLNGKGTSREPTKKFDVIFFANQEQYVSQLSSWVKGIEQSTGYYNDSAHASFFYASEDSTIHDAWRHELTHQLFQESVRSVKSPFNDEFVWLAEGIAMYFESLADFGPYVTLGGFESRRLQFSRIRKFREGYYVPLEELSAIGRTDFQQRPDMARLYSQSAGLTHMLMDGGNGASQSALTEFLKLLYQGKLKPGTFESVIGKSFADLDEQYNQFLAVKSDQVEKFLTQPDRRTELALAGAALTDRAFDAISRCHHLQWLDLTANQVSAAQIQKLADCDQLSQLFMTNCTIDAATLESLRVLKSLAELDLSGSSVTDQSLSALDSGSGLKILRLTRTKITDAGLNHLARLQELESLELAESGVTASGIAWLQSQRPQLKINQD
jgi:hypothetical protein